MTEIKKPTTTDKKVLLLTKLLIELRRKVTMATAILTEIFDLNISSSSFPLQDSVDSAIFEWDKFSDFKNFHDIWQLENMKSLRSNLAHMKIAKTILVKRGESPLTSDKWLGNLDEIVNLKVTALPDFRDWSF